MDKHKEDMKNPEKKHEESEKADIKVNQEDLFKKQAEVEEYKDKLLRLHAEFDNFKKRVIKEKQDYIKFANDVLILELLYIFDNFERALAAADKTQDFKVLHQGVEMILLQMQGFLKERGLEKIKTMGELFDPNRHEALEQIEQDNCEDNVIVEEFQPGYSLNDRVVRPAKVKVAKKKEK